MDPFSFTVYTCMLCVLFSTSVSIPDLNFSFEVYPVKDCPMDKEAWELASARLQCNKTHGYHCVPNKQFTSLIEFCYPKGYKYPFESGNCLELAGNGILNQIPCNTFSSGCPDRFFFSNELYKFPKCLTINMHEHCFDADVPCICSRFMKTLISKNNTTAYQDNSSSTNISFNAIVFCLAFLYLLISLFLVTKIMKCLKQRNIGCRKLQSKGKADEEAEPMVDKKNGSRTTEVKEPQDQIAKGDAKECAFSKANEAVVVKNFRVESIKDAYKNTLQKLQDMIVQGNKQGFNHLITEVKKDSLEELNVRGLNCLHLSAKAGDIQIFENILAQGVNIATAANDERNVLHIAAHQGNYAICEFILQKHKDLFSNKDRYKMNPAHWAALAGQRSILELMMKYECDLTETTEPYKENIVLFACMGKSLEVCQFVGSNASASVAQLLKAQNREGWSSIQYAAKSGDLKVFEYLVDQGVDIENKSRKTGKNCFHTACEKGHVEICEYILRKKPELLKELDKNEQHVGHFAAKSGNTSIMKLLLKHVEKSFLQKTTPDNINILHIACRHARFDMCVEIAKEFPFMIKDITEKGWNAALFITERAGAENERIEILKMLRNAATPLNVYHVSRSGKTILFNACVNRSPKLVQYLLETFSGLPEIEKSMDPIEAANSTEISSIFTKYYKESY